ncbi:MAG: SDR family NAD(P)-dependent oxidoreductase [Myxococcota bacterium]|nr:SDR family NAD(P)-dependent oxidoreductase [Myxococcota bacterium]
MAGRFEGKTVIITGAAGGIGLAAVTRFASEGASIVAVDPATGLP